jgi:membrane-associated phospholipid phosphatase
MKLDGGSALSLRVSLVLAVLLTTGCATNRWVDLAVHDAKEVVTAPARASSETWKKAAIVTGAVLATSALDESVQEFARDHQSDGASDASEVITPFGGRYSDRVMIGFLGYGLLGRNERAKTVAFDAFVSSVIASKVVTPVLKAAVGRNRPNESEGAFEFDGGSSFPSNHATQAFAVASVIAGHYESRWVDAAAYGLATLVGAARVYEDAHWLSDTVAGAVIGTATGQFIVRTNRRYRAQWTVMPIYDRERRGVLVSIEMQ